MRYLEANPDILLAYDRLISSGNDIYDSRPMVEELRKVLWDITTPEYQAMVLRLRENPRRYAQTIARLRAGR